MKNVNINWTTVKDTYAPELKELGLSMTMMHDRDHDLHITTIFRKKRNLHGILERRGWHVEGEYKCSEHIIWVRMEKVITQAELNQRTKSIA